MASQVPWKFLNGEAFAKAVKKHDLDLAQAKAAAAEATKAKSRAYYADNSGQVAEKTCIPESFTLDPIDRPAMMLCHLLTDLETAGAYSKFRVGSALLTKTTLPITSAVNEAPAAGISPLTEQSTHEPVADSSASTSKQQIISGGNLENGSYGVGTCAERVAFATAMMLGHVGHTENDGRGIAAVFVTADLDEPISPCGACRQFMSEFLPASTPVFMFGREDNLVEMTMGELLPFPFEK